MKTKILLYKEIVTLDLDPICCSPECTYFENHTCTLFAKPLGSPDIHGNHMRCRQCLEACDAREPGLPVNCHDCNAAPGECHNSGCDIERCSVCGGQWISCGHEEHDPQFARWSGWWPGTLESRALGIDLNHFYTQGWAGKLFVKPKATRNNE